MRYSTEENEIFDVCIKRYPVTKDNECANLCNDCEYVDLCRFLVELEEADAE